MRPSDLPSPEAFADRPHGTRIRYVSGCRCGACRAANTAYERGRAKARRRGDWNGLVSSAAARAHLDALSAAGVGRRTVGDISGVSDSILSAIRRGTKTHVRARTEKAILAVTAEATGEAALVDAKPTWTKIRKLLREGFTRGEIAVRIGLKTRALQLGHERITAKSARRVERLYRQIMEGSDGD